MMYLSSSADNIRYNGTGRAYAGAVAGSSFDDLGDMETFNFSMSVSTEKIRTNRNATRSTILEPVNERDAILTFGLRENTDNNVKMVLMGGDFSASNQSASYVYQTDPTLVDDLYVDLGHLNVFSTKLTGTITGTLDVGDSVTQLTSGATGKIAFKASGYIELCNVSGTFQAGLQVYETQDTNYIIPTVETLADIVMTDVSGATRRVNGTDYTLDADYGYIRQLSTGTTAATDVVSYDYEAVNKQHIWAMSESIARKKIIFVTAKDDLGPRARWTFHKVQINLNGDIQLLGAGGQYLSVTGTVLFDSSQPAGQEYFKKELIG